MPHCGPLLHGAHLPLLKFWYLEDEDSGRKARPVGLAQCWFPSPRPLPAVTTGGRSLGVSNLHALTPALRPLPLLGQPRRASQPSSQRLSSGKASCSVPVPPGIHLSPSHLAPAPNPVSQGTHPRGWGRTAAACPSCTGVGQRLRRGWEKAPGFLGVWRPQSHSPPVGPSESELGL